MKNKTMMNKWIRTGDRVIVTSGNDRGKTGTVMSRSSNRVIIQGINIRKKHMKRQKQEQTSQIVEMEMPIHISNIQVCSEAGKPVKLHVQRTDNDKNLIYKENGKEIVYRSLKKHVG